MKCRRCKTQNIQEEDVNGEMGYYCENCGANYALIDDSGA